MLAKFIIVIALALVIGVVLLDLRQQRIDAMHEMAAMHRQMNSSRQAVWNRQARIAERIHPAKLQQAIERSGLTLEPITPGPVDVTAPPPRQTALQPMDAP